MKLANMPRLPQHFNVRRYPRLYLATTELGMFQKRSDTVKSDDAWMHISLRAKQWCANTVSEKKIQNFEYEGTDGQWVRCKKTK